MIDALLCKACAYCSCFSLAFMPLLSHLFNGGVEQLEVQAVEEQQQSEG